MSFLDYDDYGDEELDDRLPWSEQRLIRYRRMIQRECEMPHEVRHPLTEGIVSHIRSVRHDIEVLAPEDFKADDAYRTFMEHEKPSGMYYKMGRGGRVEYDYEKELRAMKDSRKLPHTWNIDPADCMDALRRDLEPKNRFGDGFVDFPSRDRVTLRYGVRRGQAPSPEQTAEGAYYMQFLGEEWGWNKATPMLYAEIEKHMENFKTDDPYEWAFRRAKIVSGYSILGAGKDCPPPFLAEVYENMASIACNTVPPGHGMVKEYAVSEREQQLLISLYGFYADTVSPEMVAVVLDHAASLSPEDLTREPFRTFFKALPEMLGNGLNVDRLIEFGNLKEGMEMCTAMYRGKKPWWFKEDFNLRSGKSLLTEYAEKDEARGSALTKELALKAGFAYEHVLHNFLTAGYVLKNISPFTETDAVEFTVFLTERYGIGNFNRFHNVFQYCSDVLRAESEDRRPARLAMLKEHLDEVRPSTVTFGRLELKDAVFHVPGLMEFVSAIKGSHSIEERKLHPLRVGLEDLDDLKPELALPLGIRAQKFGPAVHPGYAGDKPQGLLTSMSPQAKLALPMSDHQLTPTEVASGALGQFDFYAQMRAECGGIDTSVAENYFSYCATKMPDPWHPPKGFLKFLQVFDQIDTPGWRFWALEHPNDRDAVARENHRREVSKQMLVSNMLDAMIMELLSAKEAEGLFLWLTEDVSEERKKRIEARLNVGRAQLYLECDNDPDPEDHRTPEERASDRMRHEEHELEDAIREEEKEIRTSRLIMLQETFSILTVINSMSIAGSFTRPQLASALRKTLLPKTLTADEPVEPNTGLILQADLLTNLEQLQRVDGVDAEALRSAVDNAGSSEQAFDVVQQFLQDTVMKSMQISIGRCIPDAIVRVENEMLRLRAAESEDPARELADFVEIVRGELREDLERIWRGASFVSSDIVDRLLREFKIQDYAEIFGPLHRFNSETLPTHLPPEPENPLFADIHQSNMHSARMLYFVGARWIQEHRGVENRHDGRSFKRLEEKHGSQSRVNVVPGARQIGSAVSDIISGGSDGEGEVPEDLYAALAAELPQLQERVDRWRIQDIPLGPIGGRWHFDNPVSEKHLQLFKQLLSLGATPFRMIHSNTSLIIPGFASRREMKAFILMLALEGLIDPTRPELQLGTTGRLHPDLCAYFGSSNMLGTAECAPFKVDSFVADSAVNTWLTDARIVAYDAYPESEGQRKNFELPFMNQGPVNRGKNVEGRTDILGRWHVCCDLGDERPDLHTMDDIDITHFVGAALRHVQHGGPLEGAGRAYMDRHREILAKYGLQDVLHAPWVNTRGEAMSADPQPRLRTEHFDRCVKPCMDAHFAHAQSFAVGSGVVFDVRENIDTLIRQAETVRETVLRDPAYEHHVRALLQKTTYESLQ